MASVGIIITQHGTSSGSGESRQDLVLNELVTLSNISGAGITSYKWELIGKPYASSATLNSSSSSVVNFTPDVDGSYLIQLTVNNKLKQRVVAAILTDRFGIRIPAPGEGEEFLGGSFKAITESIRALEGQSSDAIKIHGNNISSRNPGLNDFLRYDGEKWISSGKMRTDDIGFRNSQNIFIKIPLTSAIPVNNFWKYYVTPFSWKTISSGGVQPVLGFSWNAFPHGSVLKKICIITSCSSLSGKLKIRVDKKGAIWESNQIISFSDKLVSDTQHVDLAYTKSTIEISTDEIFMHGNEKDDVVGSDDLNIRITADGINNFEIFDIYVCFQTLAVGLYNGPLIASGGDGEGQEDGYGGGCTLNQAYNFGGSGEGRIIFSDNGAVEIVVPNESNNSGLTINQNDITNNPSALIINNLGSGPSISSDGNLTIKDQYLTNPISISQSGVIGLVGFTTATSIVGALNEVMAIPGGGTLDTAYNFGGPGAGKEIIADSGPVDIFSDPSGDTALFRIMNSNSSLTIEDMPSIMINNIGENATIALSGTNKIFAANIMYLNVINTTYPDQKFEQTIQPISTGGTNFVAHDHRFTLASRNNTRGNVAGIDLFGAYYPYYPDGAPQVSIRSYIVYPPSGGTGSVNIDAKSMCSAGATVGLISDTTSPSTGNSVTNLKALSNSGTAIVSIDAESGGSTAIVNISASNDITLKSTWGNILFNDVNLSFSIPISQSGVIELVGFTTATSIIGALNELKSEIGGHNPVTLNESSVTGGLSLNDQEISFRAATGSLDGYLKSSDWNIFNNKESAITKGDLISNTTSVISISNGVSSVIGTGTSITINKASSTIDGYIGKDDWTTFNSKEPAQTKGSISSNTTSVLTITSGSNSTVGPNVSFEISKSSITEDGYLGKDDWNTFNNKSDYSDPLETRGDLLYVNSSNITDRLEVGLDGYILSTDGTDVFWKSVPAAHDPVTLSQSAIIGGLNLSNQEISFRAATSSLDGYLKSSDWNTFNNKSDYSDPLEIRGDLLYVNSSGETDRFGLGPDGYVLSSGGGDIIWKEVSGSSGGVQDYSVNWDQVISGSSSVTNSISITMDRGMLYSIKIETIGGTAPSGADLELADAAFSGSHELLYQIGAHEGDARWKPDVNPTWKDRNPVGVENLEGTLYWRLTNEGGAAVTFRVTIRACGVAAS